MQIVTGKLHFFLRKNSIDNRERNVSLKQMLPTGDKFTNKDCRVLKIRVIQHWGFDY